MLYIYIYQFIYSLLISIVLNIGAWDMIKCKESQFKNEEKLNFDGFHELKESIVYLVAVLSDNWQHRLIALAVLFERGGTLYY